MPRPEEDKESKKGKGNYHSDKDTPNQEHDSNRNLSSVVVTNPLAGPLSWRHEGYRRVKLFPWWLRYNFGIAREAALKDKIIKLASDVGGLEHNWTSRVLRHAVSEFSKKGLGSDYYGYHNIDHELEAVYFTLLAVTTKRVGGRSGNGISNSNNNNNNNNNNNSSTSTSSMPTADNSTNEAKEGSTNSVKTKISQEDIKYLFTAALFHDYDPLKQFDKPHEDSVEWFLRNDKKILRFIKDIGIDLNIVLALIHRTAYPFKGTIAENAKARMQKLFTLAGIPQSDTPRREHYENVGWFLSVSERIAGYALGNFEHAMELARRNAHALGWHPSRINEESVKYFSSLKEEKEMFEYVFEGLDDKNKNNFYNNVQAFRDAWQKELVIRNSIITGQITLVPAVERIAEYEDNNKRQQLIESILEIYRNLPSPVRINEKKFKKTISNIDTIIITLRINDKSGEIVGYVKGGRLENYELRRGTHDENLGKKNTAYMEYISIKPSYWGAAGGHLMRIEFLKETKHRGYRFVSSYVHRNVIQNRINAGENIEIVQKYDPDKLDYYRIDLSKLDVERLLPQPLSSKIVQPDAGLDENSPSPILE